ncbi:MAG: helix-turn-helix transcriptional regulator, partial [Candidatus Omnitrophota bacterium]
EQMGVARYLATLSENKAVISFDMTPVRSTVTRHTPQPRALITGGLAIIILDNKIRFYLLKPSERRIVYFGGTEVPANVEVAVYSVDRQHRILMRSVLAGDGDKAQIALAEIAPAIESEHYRGFNYMPLGAFAKTWIKIRTDSLVVDTNRASFSAQLEDGRQVAFSLINGGAVKGARLSDDQTRFVEPSTPYSLPDLGYQAESFDEEAMHAHLITVNKAGFVGERIAYLVRQRGFQQDKDFLAAAGVSSSTFSVVKSRKERPNPANLLKIARALKVDPLVLLTGTSNVEAAVEGLSDAQIIELLRVRNGWTQTDMVAHLESQWRAMGQSDPLFEIGSTGKSGPLNAAAIEMAKRATVAQWERGVVPGSNPDVPQKREVLRRTLGYAKLCLERGDRRFRTAVPGETVKDSARMQSKKKRAKKQPAEIVPGPKNDDAIVLPSQSEASAVTPTAGPSQGAGVASASNDSNQASKAAAEEARLMQHRLNQAAMTALMADLADPELTADRILDIRHRAELLGVADRVEKALLRYAGSLLARLGLVDFGTLEHLQSQRPELMRQAKLLGIKNRVRSALDEQYRKMVDERGAAFLAGLAGRLRSPTTLGGLRELEKIIASEAAFLGVAKEAAALMSDEQSRRSRLVRERSELSDANALAGLSSDRPDELLRALYVLMINFYSKVQC